MSKEIRVFNFLTQIHNNRTNLFLIEDLRKQFPTETVTTTVSKLDFNVNYRNETSKRTLLMLACLTGHLDIALVLVKNGAKINLYDVDGNTALIYALNVSSVFEHNSDIKFLIRALLESGANPNYINNKGKTALHYIFKESKNRKSKSRFVYDAELLSLLLQYNADPNIELSNSFNILQDLLDNNELILAKKLLKSGYSYKSEQDRINAAESIAKLEAKEYSILKYRESFKYDGIPIGNTIICPECGHRVKVGVFCKCGKLYT